MQIHQLFVETLRDIRQKLDSNPTEYQLLKVSSLLRQILLENLLEDASTATSMEAKFKVVLPKPYVPSAQLDAAWVAMHAVHPEVKRVNVGVGMRGGLMSGVASEPGDQVLELLRKDFLAHPIGLTLSDVQYSVESVLRVAANSLGGTHNDGKPNRNKEAEELRKYMESGGAHWFGRSMPSAFVFEIACCTLRACEPLADELERLGLYSPAVSEWAWDGSGTATSGLFSGMSAGTNLYVECLPVP
ncbi:MULTISPECIES: hypothetical protein [Mycobacterium]|uniref:hypothetical protein n=1 Tax=Mycobacterium TaxID=1763 RepID=UPI00025D536D|nr:MULTISPECIES: hypothetical protein [Mycobacterium]AFJ35470.1 hypothetical protein W7S_12525 [Mycobacterium sp. MOTT36Y]ASX00646.1 hypothetical protein CKJ58_12530 [Mycobacterium intracellulare subsp. chimaera]ELR85160.1 hypothetical protein W7U_08025 [Mycobacterium sp. H4Y]PBA63417.1 hypothetical protein CKJ56_11515 [Mycobacterium intracellulare subsp. chimaera]